jgi:hypothetical protein
MAKLVAQSPKLVQYGFSIGLGEHHIRAAFAETMELLRNEQEGFRAEA